MSKNMAKYSKSSGSHLLVTFFKNYNFTFEFTLNSTLDGTTKPALVLLIKNHKKFSIDFL